MADATPASSRMWLTTRPRSRKSKESCMYDLERVEQLYYILHTKTCIFAP